MSKPRLKPIVEYYSTEGKILFFKRPGIAIEIADDNNFIRKVCEEMDGKKTVEEIYFNLKINYPQEVIYLDDLLTVLNNEKLLEDTTVSKSTSFTPYEINRWSRNIEFFNSYCKATENKYQLQERLNKARITVLGLGGVGSNVIYNLAAMGVKNIRGVDCDVVELSNLNRQIMFDEKDIGKDKASLVSKRINSFSPATNIEVIHKRITSSSQIAEIILDQDLVVAAIDHPRDQIMDWINDACVKNSVPFICGSLDSDIITCFSIIPGQTGCIECWKKNKVGKQLLFQDILKADTFVASNNPNVAIMPMISIVTGIISSEILKLVTRIADPLSLGKLYSYNFITAESKILEQWQPHPECSTCRRG